MSAEADRDPKEQPLISHLIELRDRLLRCIICVTVVFLAIFYWSNDIFDFATKPLSSLLNVDQHMIDTKPLDSFFIPFMLTMMVAFFISIPYVMYQLWAFIAPGLYKNERSAFLPFLVASPILFLIGSAFLYYVMMPFAWRFFLGFQAPGGPDTLPVQLEARVSEYITLVMKLIFAFGLSFQLPVLLTLLIRANLISADSLVKKRRYAIVGVFIFAAVVTPPDPISQISLAIPLLLLYEGSIWSGRWVERQRAKREKEAEAELRKDIEPL